MAFTRAKRAKTVQDLLDLYFQYPQVPLVFHDPFTLLVAVCLSAQCTDARVNVVTPQLFKLAPTPLKLSKMKENELAALIHTCGLASSKARRLIAMAKQLLDFHKGEVPSTFEELEALEGVGHKTASVVMSQAFGKPAFAVDTHILRVANRWGLSSSKTAKGVEEDLKKCFPKEAWSKVHLQMILFARKYCPARNHQVEKCPICQALQKA